MDSTSRKEIKLLFDVSSVRESLQQLAPMLKQMESQLRINIPVGMQPGAGGMPGYRMTPGGILINEAPSLAAASGMSQMQQLRQLPGYQYLQAQDILRTRMADLPDKPVTSLLEERARQKGGSGDITALGALVEHSKKLDEKFEKLASTLDELEKAGRKLTDAEMEKATTAKKEMAEIGKARSEMLKAAGVDVQPPPGGAGILGQVGGAIAGMLTTGAVLKAGMALARTPLERMEAEAAMARIHGRDITAAQGTAFGDLVRMDPGARRQAEWGRVAGGVSGALSGYTMGGAVAGGAIGAIGGPLGIAIGAAIGGGLGMIAQFVRKAPQHEAALGWEQAMEAQVGKQAPQMALFEAASNIIGRTHAFQQALGISDRRMLAGGYAGLRGAMRGTGFGLDELLSGAITGAGMGGGAGMAFGQMGRLGTLGRAVGMSPSELAQFGVGIGGAGGIGNEGNWDRMYDAVRKGVAAGFTDAPVMRQYLQAVTSLTAAFGGGMGPGGTQAAAEMAVNAMKEFGAAGPAIAGAGGPVIAERMQARGGRLEYANWAAVRRVLDRPEYSRMLQAMNPRDRVAVQMMLLRAGPGTLEDKGVQQMMEGLGFRPGNWGEFGGQLIRSKMGMEDIGGSMYGALLGQGGEQAAFEGGTGGAAADRARLIRTMTYMTDLGLEPAAARRLAVLGERVGLRGAGGIKPEMWGDVQSMAAGRMTAQTFKETWRDIGATFLTEQGGYDEFMKKFGAAAVRGGPEGQAVKALEDAGVEVKNMGEKARLAASGIDVMIKALSRLPGGKEAVEAEQKKIMDEKAAAAKAEAARQKRIQAWADKR